MFAGTKTVCVAIFNQQRQLVTIAQPFSRREDIRLQAKMFKGK